MHTPVTLDNIFHDQLFKGNEHEDTHDFIQVT
jgi:hypothetical protein